MERLKPSPPFLYCGLDLFGPILFKDVVKKRAKMKCYGVIFCYTTRALYMDIACDYDTESFIIVLRRFISIRGCPRQIFCDPGSQLISASKQFKECFTGLDHSKMEGCGATHGIEWKINKSADAPWENGCTESLIKSVKRCLNLIVGQNVLSYPELQTVFFECSDMLNGRPVGTKNGSCAYICPNDILLGRASNLIPVANYNTTANLKKQFQFIESLVQNFWRRWHTHYFPFLILQQKWHTSKRNVQVGDIVLVQDAKAIRGDWKLAEVKEVKSSKDDKVRDVILRYKVQGDSRDYKGVKDTIIDRSVHRLVIVVPAEERWGGSVSIATR